MGKTDFTGCGPYLMAGLLGLMAFGLVLSLLSIFGGGMPDSKLRLVFACCGVLVFVLFIIYDTQMILGGAHVKHEFSVDDYVLAALSLYLDVINLFLYLLQIFGDRQ